MMLSLASPFGNDEADPSAEANQIARIVKVDYSFDDPGASKYHSSPTSMTLRTV